MFLKINFNRALIISFLWHIFWFLAVTIVFTLPGRGIDKMSDISFLGSILDRGAFQKEFGDWHQQQQRAGQPTGDILISDRHGMLLDRVRFDNKEDYLIKGRQYASSIGDILETEKRLPSEAGLIGGTPLAEDMAGQQYKAGEVGSRSGVADEYFLLSNGLAVRGVLFKPEMPDCRGMIDEGQAGGIDNYYNVRLRLLVGPDGHVKFVDKLQSCGYPEVDLIAIRYAQKWSFTPLGPGDSLKDDQEGTLDLRLRAR